MEGVTVGQVFDAECILNKRPRKVWNNVFYHNMETLDPLQLFNSLPLLSFAGEVWVFGEVERVVVQVSSYLASSWLS